MDALLLEKESAPGPVTERFASGLRGSNSNLDYNMPGNDCKRSAILPMPILLRDRVGYQA
jgi:hypothetical protein